MDKETLRQRRELITSQKLHAPTVFKQQIDHWECRQWTLADWAVKLNSKKLKFRVGPVTNQKGGPLWEHQCKYVKATVEEFMQRHQATPENPFHQYPSSAYWAYADYKYMADLFNSENHINKTVDWSFLGFEGRDGADSTFWLGENHSYTPCHYDTYGCNLVAQLIGSKHWVMFPPADTPSLYPTRIPYEESSVFSQVDISNPDLVAHPMFKTASPYVVTLHPGDVMYVPPKWWHFVQSTSDVTLSINTWIELGDDNNRRFEEAVCRLLVTNFTQMYPMDNWLNPTEEIASPDINLRYVQHCLKTLKKSEEKKAGDDDRLCEDRRLVCLVELLNSCFGRENYFFVEKGMDYNYQKKRNYNQGRTSSSSSVEDAATEKKFLTALLDPEVILLICKKLSEQPS